MRFRWRSIPQALDVLLLCHNLTESCGEPAAISRTEPGNYFIAGSHITFMSWLYTCHLNSGDKGSYSKVIPFSGLWLTDEILRSPRLWLHSVTERDPARHVHPPTSLPGCESQSAHARREAVGSLSLYQESWTAWTAASHQSCRQSFITDIPHTLLSPEGTASGTAGLVGSFANQYGQVQIWI